jgi:hypothetical protein
MGIKDRAIGVAQKVMQGGAVRSFFGFWNGRCTFFACAFSVVGVYGWLVLNRDLTSFALFAGAIQALLVAHSWKEDVAAQNQAQQQNTTVVNNITMPPTADKPAS